MVHKIIISCVASIVFFMKHYTPGNIRSKKGSVVFDSFFGGGGVVLAYAHKTLRLTSIPWGFLRKEYGVDRNVERIRFLKA